MVASEPDECSEVGKNAYRGVYKGGEWCKLLPFIQESGESLEKSLLFTSMLGLWLVESSVIVSFCIITLMHNAVIIINYFCVSENFVW